MSSYTITIAPDDPTRATTTLRIEVQDAQVQITELRVRAGTDGLTAGQLPAVDLDQLLRAVSPATMTPAVGAPAVAAPPVRDRRVPPVQDGPVPPGENRPVPPVSGAVTDATENTLVRPAPDHPDRPSSVDGVDLAPAVGTSAAENGDSPGGTRSTRDGTTAAGKSANTGKGPITRTTSNAGKRTNAGKATGAPRRRSATAGTAKAGPARAGATRSATAKAATTRSTGTKTATRKAANAKAATAKAATTKAAAGKATTTKAAATKTTGTKTAAARAGQNRAGTAKAGADRIAGARTSARKVSVPRAATTGKTATAASGVRGGRTGKATPSSAAPTTRSYRRAPTDLAEVVRQAGSASAVADHYGVPRYTAQSWVRTLRRNTATPG